MSHLATDETTNYEITMLVDFQGSRMVVVALCNISINENKLSTLLSTKYPYIEIYSFKEMATNIYKN